MGLSRDRDNSQGHRTIGGPPSTEGVLCSTKKAVQQHVEKHNPGRTDLVTETNWPTAGQPSRSHSSAFQRRPPQFPFKRPHRPPVCRRHQKPDLEGLASLATDSSLCWPIFHHHPHVPSAHPVARGTPREQPAWHPAVPRAAQLRGDSELQVLLVSAGSSQPCLRSHSMWPLGRGHRCTEIQQGKWGALE